MVVSQGQEVKECVFPRTDKQKHARGGTKVVAVTIDRSIRVLKIVNVGICTVGRKPKGTGHGAKCTSKTRTLRHATSAGSSPRHDMTFVLWGRDYGGQAPSIFTLTLDVPPYILVCVSQGWYADHR